MTNRYKYDLTGIVQIECCYETTHGELDILTMFSNGMSMRDIEIETGTHRTTVSSIIQRNLKGMLQKAFK